MRHAKQNQKGGCAIPPNPEGIGVPCAFSMDKPDIITTDSADDQPSTQAYVVLKEEFYNRIKAGTKKTEYRDFTEYWIQRLLDHPLKTIKLNRGYSEDHMIFEIDWIGVIDGEREIHAFDENGEMNEEGKGDDFHPDTISINLGKRLK